MMIILLLLLLLSLLLAFSFFAQKCHSVLMLFSTTAVYFVYTFSSIKMLATDFSLAASVVAVREMALTVSVQLTLYIYLCLNSFVDSSDPSSPQLPIHS